MQNHLINDTAIPRLVAVIIYIYVLGHEVPENGEFAVEPRRFGYPHVHLVGQVRFDPP